MHTLLHQLLQAAGVVVDRVFGILPLLTTLHRADPRKATVRVIRVRRHRATGKPQAVAPAQPVVAELHCFPARMRNRDLLEWKDPIVLRRADMDWGYLKGSSPAAI